MLTDRFEIRPIDPAAEWQTAAGVEAACFPPHEACKPDKMKARAEAAPDFFLVAIDRKTGTMASILNGLGTDEAVFRDDFFLLLAGSEVIGNINSLSGLRQNNIPQGDVRLNHFRVHFRAVIFRKLCYVVLRQRMRPVDQK